MNNPVHKILKRKADNDGKCEVCGVLLDKIRIDYLCEWCRGIKNVELPRRRPEGPAKRCKRCQRVLNKEDLELSKISGEDICWNCTERGGRPVRAK